MDSVSVPLVRRGFGQTLRRDAWWTTPAVVFLVFASSDRENTQATGECE